MGWGLAVLENSSVAAAAVAAVTWGWTPKIQVLYKNIEYQMLREWTLEPPSRRDTTWKLITAALRVFLVFTTWGDRPEIRFWSPKNITHVIFSRCIFSKILLKNVQTHLLDLIYYI